jgi:hypothetical protein
MEAKRFGRKLRLPATAAIKHQIRVLMLEDLIAADAREGAIAIPLQPKGIAPHSVLRFTAPK